MLRVLALLQWCMPDNPFSSLWVPLFKSEETHHGATTRVIQGIASTEDRDSQGESMLLEGVDFQPFLIGGFFNWNHSHAPEDIIGEPWAANIVRDPKSSGLMVKGHLYDGVERADKVWNLITEMSKGGRRQMGFSVEGSCQRRNGVIHKSVVEHVAVTHQPVNTQTWAEVAKSLVKSMTTQTAAPLMREDLAGGNASKLFAGPCSCGERSQSYEFPRGKVGAVTHLVRCAGMSGDQAADVITRLYRSRIFN